MIEISSILPSLLDCRPILLLMPDFDSALGIFASIAWLASFLALIFFCLAFFGANALDIGVDVGDGDLGYFSIQAILGFLLGLGWGGYICIELGASTALACILGILLGVIMFIIVANIIRILNKLEVDGNVEAESLVGTQGSVYITIPPHGELGGQVQLNHPNGLLTISAVQEGDSPLPLQTAIIVVESTPQRIRVKAL